MFKTAILFGKALAVVALGACAGLVTYKFLENQLDSDETLYDLTVDAVGSLGITGAVSYYVSKAAIDVIF